jgi:hypothetical protein
MAEVGAMKAQPAQLAEWACRYCGTTVPAAYAHKCLEYDAVTFLDGSPLAPMPDHQEIAEIADKTKWIAGPLNNHDRHWVMVGARHGFLRGWHAGFVAASGMEAPSGGETGTGSTEGDSPTAESGDAQNQSAHKRLGDG